MGERGVYLLSRNLVLLCRVFLLSACVSPSPVGNASVSVGCTEDFATYRKELKRMMDESKSEEERARLQKIIEEVECKDE